MSPSISRRRRVAASAIAIAAAIVVADSSGFAAAAKKPVAEPVVNEPRRLNYAILKGGDPIGAETVLVKRGGDQTTVDVNAQTRVKVMMINFTYDHKRREVWRGGKLESMQAETNDDGTPHKIDMVAAGSGYRLTVDGKTSDLPADALPLTLWTADVLN
ncbi:hypothetical protein JZU48_00575, partial [bacterium]|nr:hypothetical protein [bacterium]